MKKKIVRETLTGIGVVSLFAVGFTLLGLLIDISIILKHDYTPISFTFTLLFIGALIGLFLAFMIVRQRK